MGFEKSRTNIIEVLIILFLWLQMKYIWTFLILRVGIDG